MKKIKYHNLREYVPVVIGIILLAVLGIILVFFINYENPSKILVVPEKEVSAKYKEKKVDISSSTCPKVNISKYKEMADELKTDEIAQIQNIISREMSAKVENIHIMTKKP